MANANTIKIFPLSNAGTGNGHNLSEGNIASLISALSSPGHEDFVVAATITANECEAIKFVMQGRFFDINFNSYIATSYYATIYISDEALTPITDPEETSGSVEPQAAGEPAGDVETNDSPECFIQFNTERPEIASNHYTLQLLEKLDNGTLRVPIRSQFQLKGNRIENINGGTV